MLKGHCTGLSFMQNIRSVPLTSYKDLSKCIIWQCCIIKVQCPGPMKWSHYCCLATFSLEIFFLTKTWWKSWILIILFCPSYKNSPVHLLSSKYWIWWIWSIICQCKALAKKEGPNVCCDVDKLGLIFLLASIKKDCNFVSITTNVWNFLFCKNFSNQWFYICFLRLLDQRCGFNGNLVSGPLSRWTGLLCLETSLVTI